MTKIPGKPPGARREVWNRFSLQAQEETNRVDLGLELLPFITVRVHFCCLSHTCLVSFTFEDFENYVPSIYETLPSNPALLSLLLLFLQFSVWALVFLRSFHQLPQGG